MPCPDDAWLLSHLGELLDHVRFVGQIDFFRFGSSLNSLSSASDLDLVVLYEQAEDCRKARKAVGLLPIRSEVDLIQLSIEEDKHYDFVDGVGARHICSFGVGTDGEEKLRQ